jgi:hypothetical protein
MRRKFAVLSLAFAWLCANGAIWDLAQVVAWGKMFAGYSSTLSVGAALRETLDPAKACELCAGVAKAKESSGQTLPSASRDGAKLVLALESDSLVVRPPESREWTTSPLRGIREWCDAVPVPPPRV